MPIEGTFSGWIPGKAFGFIRPDDGSPDVFLHQSQLLDPSAISRGVRLGFETEATQKGRSAINVAVLPAGSRRSREVSGGNRANRAPAAGTKQESLDPVDDSLLSEEIEELDTDGVTDGLLAEIARWKREAKAEDNARYFWHVREVDQISQGEKYFVIGRKGSGKTAICEHFANIRSPEVFAERLSFKNFPFNELYEHKNQKYTTPNQFITIWKYLIYSTICRLMLKNEGVDGELRSELARLYDDKTSLSRRIGRWVGKDFGVSLFGISVTLSGRSEQEQDSPKIWTEHVDFLEDLISRYAGSATYYVLFDELDEDYRDIVATEQYDQYTALITSLFKAVQDVRTTFAANGDQRFFPVIFLRDDIYDIVKDSDKNKWGDFRVDLNWDADKIRRLIAFRITRAIDGGADTMLPFDRAWEKVFGQKQIKVGQRKKAISTFEFICRSTLLRPRDFVSYLQNCAQHAIDGECAHNAGRRPLR